MKRSLIPMILSLSLVPAAFAQVATPPATGAAVGGNAAVGPEGNGSVNLGGTIADPLNRTSTSPGATTLEVGADGQVRREGAAAQGSTQVEVVPRFDVPQVNVPAITPDAAGSPTGNGVTGSLDTTATGAVTGGNSTGLPLTSGLIQGRVEAGTTPDTLFLVTGDGNRFLINDPARVAELRSSLGSTISVTGSVSPVDDPNLPPGLANQQTLPPGLQRETLPPGLQNRAQTQNTLSIEGFQVLPPANGTGL